MKQPIKLLVFFLIFAACQPIIAANIKETPDFSHFKVYGVSRPALHSITEAQVLIERSYTDDGVLSAEGKAELYRYLVYDALNHYVAFLLGIADKPKADYFAGFAPLQTVLGESFVSLQRKSIRQAVDLARQIRFDITLVKLSTKHIYKAVEGTSIDGEVAVMMERLHKVSSRLAALYPPSAGELPPVLIAFAASFFAPIDGKVPVSCQNPLPAQLKGQVLSSLSPQPVGPISVLPYEGNNSLQNLLKPSQ